jgi:hypothetical protein
MQIIHYEMNSIAPQNIYLNLKHQLAHTRGVVPHAWDFSKFFTIFSKRSILKQPSESEY